MPEEILTIAAGVYVGILAMSFTKWGISCAERALVFYAVRRRVERERREGRK